MGLSIRAMLGCQLGAARGTYSYVLRAKVAILSSICGPWLIMFHVAEEQQGTFSWPPQDQRGNRGPDRETWTLICKPGDSKLEIHFINQPRCPASLSQWTRLNWGPELSPVSHNLHHSPGTSFLYITLLSLEVGTHDPVQLPNFTQEEIKSPRATWHYSRGYT